MVRRPAAGHRGQHRGRDRRRGVGVVTAVRERVVGADGRARRQSVVHIHAVRDRRGGRQDHLRDRGPAPAVRHAVGRHRAPERRPVHRHRMVLPTGILHQVKENYIHPNYCKKSF